MNVSTIGANLSRQGLKAMYAPSVTNGKEQGTIGESYLNSIRDQADVDTERAVASSASRACRNITTWRAQVALADTAMSAIAAGVSGPIGAAVAMAGRNAMFSRTLENGKDQGSIGQSTLTSIASEATTNEERIVADTARQACNGVDRWRGQVAVADEALKTLSGGVKAEDLGGTLCQVGHDAMYSTHITTAHDQAVVGMRFTEAVARYSDDAEEKAAAQSALDAAGRVNTAASQVGILGSFLSRA